MKNFNEVLIDLCNKELLEFNERILTEMKDIENLVSSIIDKAFEGTSTEDTDKLKGVLRIDKVKVNTDDGKRYDKIRSIVCCGSIVSHIILGNDKNNLVIVRKDKNGKVIKPQYNIGDFISNPPMKMYNKLIDEVLEVNPHLLTIIPKTFDDLLARLIKDKLNTKFDVKITNSMECKNPLDKTGNAVMFQVGFEITMGRTDIKDEMLYKMALIKKEDK